ncbi:tetratricopeptide repeat (TPR)-containing protein [Artemisia annua]|uniref:Tetratricopeptide repeat (TPR)-containing protein n=1 Tax=Artemisia annua TaxID=35608 RepID=A0A2U1N514_ARTAN|nr:tetratricopeptide repeat (TPR)-containing protein [Artemisia annua]
MEGEEIIDDEMNTNDINSNQKETAELASDANATEDQNMGCSQENQAEDSNGEEDDDDEEEEEEDAEGAYTFRFEEDVNPLALTEVDANGVQPYEHLERIEYETLAAKKRKVNRNYDLQDVPAEKRLRQEDNPQALFDNLLAEMTNGRRKSKKMKKRGRRFGSRNKLSPEITRKLGDATLYYVHGRYEEAITLLKELILLSPNLPDSYHTLGMIYNAMGDKKRALAFYMLAVHLTPKDASIWKLLVTWSLEQGNRGQACYCLDRAIRADPEDIALRYHRASLYVELGEHHKAAESYEQIWQVRPKNVEALKTAATLYQKGGKHERSVNILENYMNKNPKDADLSVVSLLASMLMSANEHEKALHHIEYAQRTCSSGKELPAELLIKAGICHVHLGNMKNAEDFFSVFTHENVNDCAHLVIEVADSLMSVKHHESALKYCLMFEGSDVGNKGLLYLNIGRCYSFLSARTPAIHYLYKALHEREDDIDARLDLVSVLLEEDKEDESISVLSPPLDSESRVGLTSDRGKPWWTDVKIKLKLSYIYKSKGLTEAFVDAICPFVQETLFIETIQRKFKGKTKKRVSNSELEKRARVLNADQNDNVFQGFRPVASSLDLAKGLRAKKLLEKRRLEREQRRAEAQKAGVEWQSDNDSDDESRVYRQPPLPDLLKDEKHIMLVIDLCKGLISIKKYWEALEIITSSLKLGHNTLTTEKQEELRSLGAQISYNIDAPKNGWDCARHIVTQNPYSFAAWNCYYKATSRSNVEKQNSKFLRLKIMKHNDCIPPLIIKGHQLTAISQHQAAAINYLEAYKLMPENALINLCVGTALINLALGNRLQNKHQCVLQGLAFLYNNLRLSENSQESLYNLARAYHHVGLVSVAATYYEKVLAIHQIDLPIPRLPNDGPEVTNNLKPGYCDLKREAAYNLHLIYKNSGSVDLARQVLKDYCSL